MTAPLDGARLLRLHLDTLLADPARWATLFAEDALWELAFAPSLGHPARLEGRAAMSRHAAWFAEAVKDFQFLDVQVFPMANASTAVASMRGQGTIVSTGRSYQQEYVVFLWSKDGQITCLREYFDPVRAARAMGIALAGAE
jgi:ketosteroid isomerase-like protein